VSEALFSVPLRLAQWLRLGSRRKGSYRLLQLSVAPPDFFDFPRYEWGPWFIPRSTRFRRMSHVFEAAVNDWESRGVLTAEDFEVIESD
jgi:hypothetical protein